MFKFFTEASTKLLRKGQEMELEIVNLKNQVEALNLQIESMNKAANAVASVASMLLDFSNIDVFSVERNTKEGVPLTILGHWLADKDGVKSSAEWVLYCSDETHEKLVSEFRRHMKSDN